MSTTKANATTSRAQGMSLRELKASETQKKKTFFGFLSTKPKISENTSNVKLKGVYPRKGHESKLNTISGSVSVVKPPPISEDIYEEIHIEVSESDEENDSVKNLESKPQLSSIKSPPRHLNKESSGEEEENNQESNDSIESTKSIKSQKQMRINIDSQNNQPGKIPITYSPQPGKIPITYSPQLGKIPMNHSPQPGKIPITYSPQLGKIPMNHSPQPGKIPITYSPQLGKNPINHSSQKNALLKVKETENSPPLNTKSTNNGEKEANQENRLKFEAMLNDIKQNNQGDFRARSKSLHPGFNPVTFDQHVKFDEKQNSTAVRKYDCIYSVGGYIIIFIKEQVYRS
jgi:hypothetical protein